METRIQAVSAALTVATAAAAAAAAGPAGAIAATAAANTSAGTTSFFGVVAGAEAAVATGAESTPTTRASDSEEEASALDSGVALTLRDTSRAADMPGIAALERAATAGRAMTLARCGRAAKEARRLPIASVEETPRVIVEAIFSNTPKLKDT